MNRRMFLKILAATGVAPFIPQVSSLSSMYKSANAAIDYSSLNITASSVPKVMPQIINIFLYGGPSELSGNLSNIVEINQNSQTKYDAFFTGILEQQGTVGFSGGSITPRGFWGSHTNPEFLFNEADRALGAGGDDMEFLVSQGHMSVYRTMMNRKNVSQTHRENILLSQKGTLDIDLAPGMGNKLASIISTHRDLFQANTKLAGGTVITDVDDLIMPFVSIQDGDTRVFDKGVVDSNGSAPLPILFNGVSLKDDLSNPFLRTITNFSADQAAQSAMLDTLVQQALSEDTRDYTKVNNAFEQRIKLEGQLTPFSAGITLPDFTGATLEESKANGGSTTLAYPETNIGKSIRAAVTLAVENPGSLFITLGDAFGNWDDHNNGVDLYPGRMRDLFEALRVAMMHIKYTHNITTPVVGLNRPTDNIIINVYGDFGRRVNLNTSLGWNHGNNQNLFTLGGDRPGLRTPGGNDALGKVVGETVHVGASGEDRQFTEPTADSYEFERIAIAATTYKYFGVIYPPTVNEATPDPLTAFYDPEDPTNLIDFGSPPIDETQT